MTNKKESAIDINKRLEKFREELNKNKAMKSDLTYDLPLGFNNLELISKRVGYETNWDPQPIFEFMVDKKLFTPYFDILEKFGKDETYRNISVLNSLPENFFKCIYIPNRLKLKDDIKEPVLIPESSYVFEELGPYIFSFAGKMVTKEDFMKKTGQLRVDLKKYEKYIQRTVKKLEKMKTPTSNLLLKFHF